MNNYKNIDNEIEKVIAMSYKIEKLYEMLTKVELCYGINSKEYIVVSELINENSISEESVIENFLNSSSALYFKDYIFSHNCSRLCEKICNEYNYNKMIIAKESELKYDLDKKRIGSYISKEEFKRIDYDELGKHILKHNIFNLIQLKSYIKVLDFYIKNELDKELKKQLIEEKNTVLSRNSFLESWYFNFNENKMLLIDSDFLMSLELKMSQNEYLDCKKNFLEDMLLNYIDLLIDDDLESFGNKRLFEINVLSILLSMDLETLNDSYNYLQDDFNNNPEIYDEESKTTIDNMYSKRQLLEKKIKINFSNEEVM